MSGWVDLFYCSIVDQDDCVGIHEPSFKRWPRSHGWHYGTGILFFLVIFILYIYLSIFNSEFWLIITALLWTFLLFYEYRWLETFVSWLFLSSCCNIAERGSIFLSILYQAFINQCYCQEHGMVLLCYRKHIFLNIMFIHPRWKVDTQVGLVKCHILGVRSKVIKHWLLLHFAYAVYIEYKIFCFRKLKDLKYLISSIVFRLVLPNVYYVYHWKYKTWAITKNWWKLRWDMWGSGCVFGSNLKLSLSLLLWYWWWWYAHYEVRFSHICEHLNYKVLYAWVGTCSILNRCWYWNGFSYQKTERRIRETKERY